MTNANKRVVIDSKIGNVTNSNSLDKIVLTGVYPFKDSKYATDLEIILSRDDALSITVEIPYSGYNMQLFLADFTGNNKSEIMISGDYGGSGGYVIGAIYTYKDSNLVEIFNQDMFYKQYACIAKYVDNYKVEVICNNKKYKIDISKKPKEYLNIIYNPDGTVKENMEASVDYPTRIYPIKQNYKTTYELLIQQRIVGIANADTIGIIQTQCTLNGEILSIENKGLLTFSNLRKMKK